MARRTNDEANPTELTPEQVADISPLYHMFAARFGEEDANQMVYAGAHHRTREKKDDWFADCVIVAIAYECFTTHRLDHGFQAQPEDIEQWIKKFVPISQYADGKTVAAFRKKFRTYLQ